MTQSAALLAHSRENENKVNFAPCFINHYALKTLGEEQRHTFFTSTLDTGEWSASYLGRVTPEKRKSGSQ